jgi:opacity protein-like surface antigen
MEKGGIDMKRLITGLLIIVMLIFSLTPALADENRIGNTWASFGWQGADGEKDNNCGINFGAGMRKNSWGYEIGFINYPDYPDGKVNSSAYKVDNQYKSYDKYDVNAYGADCLYFKDMNDKFTLFGGLGLYAVKERTVVQSTNTAKNPITGQYLYYGQLFTQDESTKIKPAVSIGGQYKITDNFALGLSYHTIREFQIRFVGCF